MNYFSLGLSLLLGVKLAWADVNEVGPWGDQGDGTYKNPILPSDYSDPDPIRVGDDFYLVSSTFQLSPGVVILHSKDLVNWETIGYAVSDVAQLGDKFSWKRMANYNEGVYAPSIRYHDKKFYVYIDCHTGEGLFVATSEKPEGPYTVTQMIDKNGKPLRTSRWTDICPLWDDDGKAYFAAAGSGGLWLFQMNPEGTQLLDGDVTINKGLGGTEFWPYVGTEGNKLYKWNGYYYLYNVDFQGKGPATGKGCYLKRSKNLYGTKADGTPGGPGDIGTYDVKQLGNEQLPSQGGFVDTPEGKMYYIAQFNALDAGGRRPYLLPVTWADNWPMPGADVPPDASHQGKMVWSGPKPVLGFPIKLPQGSDEFESSTLGVNWQWNYQPRADFWSLTERPGFLRLKAFKPLEPGKFFKAGNTICQRYVKSDSVQAEIKVDLSHMADGQEAGFAHFNGGSNYCTISVVQQDGLRTLQFNDNGKITPGATLTDATIYFRTQIDIKQMASFSYSLDGTTYTPLGDRFQLRKGGYRGDLIGIFTYNNAGEAGYIDVDWFHYTYAGPKVEAPAVPSASAPRL